MEQRSHQNNRQNSNRPRHNRRIKSEQRKNRRSPEKLSCSRLASAKRLKSNKIRIGTMDLKIVSIAIANEVILVSSNLKDFEKVPDLSVQDWTRK
jgi:predicted nucleic acid-binding protein